MHKIILGSTLGIFTVVSANAIGGHSAKISIRRCGSGLKLWDVSKNDVWGIKSGTGTSEHDIYGDDSVRYTMEDNGVGTSAWADMVGRFPGIDNACEKFNNALNAIAKDFRSPATNTNQYVSSTHSWKRAVTLKLHDAGCAISPNDDNLEQFLESFNYPYQQRLRMTKAARAADEYELKIQGIQDEWKEARENLVRDMKAHGSVMKLRLKESSKEAGLHNYQGATDALLSDQEGSARREIDKVRGTVSNNGEVFEQLAQKLKRDSLRWSKLNQISKEQERLTQMTNVIDLTSFDVLSECLTNYQKEFIE